MALADWDRRLIAPETCLLLVGDIGVHFTCQRADLSQFEPEGGGPRQPDQWQINMRCNDCGQSITLLAQQSKAHLNRDDLSGAAVLVGGATSIGDLMSDVLRHRVTAHDQPLSGGKAHG